MYVRIGEVRRSGDAGVATGVRRAERPGGPRPRSGSRAAALPQPSGAQGAEPCGFRPSGSRERG